MNNYKVKLERQFIEALLEIISKAVASLTGDEADDKLLAAALVEVHEICNRKLLKVKHDYGCTFSPVQAIAIRMLYTDIKISTASPYINNQLGIISNAVHKQYC